MSEAQEEVSGVERILDAGARLFARHGFNGVSMAALAREAGMSKAAIFHYFPSKEALYYRVIQQACSETTAFLQDPARMDAPADQALARFGSYFMDHLFEHGDVSRLVLRELLESETGSDRVRTMAEEIHGESHQRLVTLIRRGQKEGLFAEAYDPALVAVTLVGAQLFFFQAQDALRHMPETELAGQPGAFAEGMIRLILNGLRPRTRDADSASSAPE